MAGLFDDFGGATGGDFGGGGPLGDPGGFGDPGLGGGSGFPPLFPDPGVSFGLPPGTGGNPTGSTSGVPGPTKLPANIDPNSTLGKILALGGGLGPLIIGILGLLRNIGGQGRQDALTKAETASLENLLRMVGDPSQFAKLVQGIQQPLNTNLIEGVMNPVQAQLAERGLGSSPGPATAITSQALAPFEQQNQQTATQAALNLLGIPENIAGAAGLPFQQTPGVFDTLLKGILGTISGVKGITNPGAKPTVGDANIDPTVRALLDPGITMPGTDFGSGGGKGSNSIFGQLVGAEA